MPRDHVGRVMNMICRVVPVQMPRKLFGLVAIEMRVPMLGDLHREFGVPFGLSLGQHGRIVARRDVDRGQQHPDRHRKGDDELQEMGCAAAVHAA